jgi:hypothetical protein
VPRSTTVFGSGAALDGGELVFVAPAHTLEGIYAAVTENGLSLANSLVALLEATGRELVPGVDYPTLISRLSDGIGHSPISIPTSAGPIELHFYENLTLSRDGSLRKSPKPREHSFGSFEEYLARIEAALASALENAAAYEPVMALSSGYDSTAVAVIAARQGCRRAFTFDGGRPRPGEPPDADSGALTALRLGMRAEIFERLAYLRRGDLPEAEFLASGTTGEDVPMLSFEPQIRGTVLINGMVGGALWRRVRSRRTDLWRSDLSGTSVTEFRLRSDFIYLPLPIFGMSEQPSIQDIGLSHAMRTYSVGGSYDEPIPRRVAEEAGIPRGSFATSKRGATSLMHLTGTVAMAPATIRAVEDFAGAIGEEFQLRARPPLSRVHRLLIRVGAVLRLPAIAEPMLRRRRNLVQFLPAPGSLLFRWAVTVVRPRYRPLTARSEQSEAI